jgi:predicted nucleic acid-binding protein
MRDEVLTQIEAWQIYDRWLDDGRIVCVDEPPTLEPMFRAATQMGRPASKDWADSYLIAFAQSGGFQLVTLDRAMEQKAKGAILLP